MAGPKSKAGWPTCSIILKGTGCREFERLNPDKTWYDFILFFITILNANPTQIDLTVDDYDGEYFDFNWIKAKLDKGNFTSTFQRNIINYMDVLKKDIQLNSVLTLQPKC